ncbi:hypothetical protein POM88_011567 [Heracleum sosnowskyi]|uniref:Uncharacterized protein n=1 Tax=Heracleum sosnowskyi TaxID=360622 RepID=A0AAD8IVQ2_9APIA|nr:hypothetical protein POM88_011567 [Heracleum sosnowskyi]
MGAAMAMNSLFPDGWFALVAAALKTPGSWTLRAAVLAKRSREYGDLLVSCGLIGEAVKVCEDLELWDTAIYSYCLLEKKALDVELIKKRLAERPSDSRLWKIYLLQFYNETNTILTDGLLYMMNSWEPLDLDPAMFVADDKLLVFSSQNGPFGMIYYKTTNLLSKEWNKIQLSFLGVGTTLHSFVKQGCTWLHRVSIGTLCLLASQCSPSVVLALLLLLLLLTYH